MSGYDHPIQMTYRFPAADVASAGVVGRIAGPGGARGRVLAITHVVTTGVTVAASTVSVGPNGAAAPARSTVAVATANSIGSATKAQLAAAADLPADTVIEVASDGGATAGAADIVVTVGWF